MNSWQQIWDALNQENKQSAALSFLDCADEDNIHRAHRIIAQHRKMRPQTILGASAEKRAHWLISAPFDDNILSKPLVVALCITEWLGCLSRLLDRLKVPHIKGVLQNPSEIAAPTVELCEKAIKATIKKHPIKQVVIICHGLHLVDDRIYANILLALAPIMLETKEGQDSSKGLQGDVAVESATENQLAENIPGDFTTLDVNLINAVVAHISKVKGAFSRDQIEDLLQECLSLNAHRHQSYFHLGFLRGLHGEEVFVNRPEYNEDRLAWLLSGAVSAYERRKDHIAILRLLDEHSSAFKPVLYRNHAATRYALPPIVAALWAVGRHQEITTLTTENAWAALPDFSAYTNYYTKASELLLQKDPERAEPHLEMLRRTVGLREAQGHYVSDSFKDFLSHRLSQAKQQRGDFDAAEEGYRALLGKGSANFQSKVEAALGLVECNIRSLSRIKFTASKIDFLEISSSLSPGKAHFSQSAKSAPGHGDYCLAFSYASEGNPQKTLEHAEKAEAAFSANRVVYERDGLLGRISLLLGWALLQELELVRTERAVECLGYAVNALGNEAHYLILDGIQALSEISPSLAAQLAFKVSAIMKNKGVASEDALDFVTTEKTLHESAELRDFILKRSTQEGRSKLERFDDARKLLTAAEKLDDGALAREALDVMQGIALRNERSKESDDFLELLETDDEVSTGWPGEEVKEALLYLYYLRGDCNKAASVLEGYAHEVLTEGSPTSIQEANEFVESISELGCDPSPELIGRIGTSAPNTDVVVKDSKKEITGKIVFLGGDAPEEKNTSWVNKRIAEEYPNVEIVYKHFGWGSNWGREVEQSARSLKGADAFVMIRLMRTMCGRKLRKIASENNVPWVPCTGIGKASIERSIRRAIELISE